MAENQGKVLDVAANNERIRQLSSRGWELTLGLSYIFPEPHDRACKAPPGFISVYYHMILDGFHFTLLRIQRMLVRRYDVQPTLLLPNEWPMINAFDLLCSLSDVPLSFSLFFSMFKHSGSKATVTWSFGAMLRKGWLYILDKVPLEWDVFVFCKPEGSLWDFETI